MMVKITDTMFRDAHQSLAATRMRTRDMLPIAEKVDEVGYFSLEVWGGATFDSCIRFLNEDPWERIRTLKKSMPNTHMQMLLRGQNLVGYRHYSDDIVEKFVVNAVKSGVDIFRIFDAVNDARNMEHSIKIAKREGAHVQGALSYTLSPVHTIDTNIAFLKELANLDCDSLCIKDMAGLISPKDAFDLVKRIKEEIGIPVDVHCHCTSGLAPVSYYAACEAGADILDTAISPFGWGTSQPPTESIVASLKGTPYDTGLDLELLVEIAMYFKEIREKYEHLINPISERVDTRVLLYQIPGGMLSNLLSQLEQQNKLDKFEEVLAETPVVREELGYPPLVTPTSQIVGTQAVLNVVMGERYKIIPKEVKDYVKGLYGKPPAPIREDIKKKIIGDEEVITVRPGDLLEPEYEKVKKEAEDLGILNKEEDVITYALYPNVAPKFLKGEAVEETLECGAPVETKAAPSAPPAVLGVREFTVMVDGVNHEVIVEAVTGGKSQLREVKTVESGTSPAASDGNGVTAPMQGTILKINVNVGDEVSEGDVVAVLEAMKMENEIVTHFSGVVKAINVSTGDLVNADDVVIVIG
ncbi:MAG: sodium-extruding oxaloacetate decarboxylase subunit alpha [Halobacteriota archaeon]|nr:sodium-extruding oxaloacetate decarboxylase subunit alpha [Halobacteriota archaeon]